MLSLSRAQQFISQSFGVLRHVPRILLEPVHFTSEGSLIFYGEREREAFSSESLALKEEGFSTQSIETLARVLEPELSPSLFFATMKSVIFVSVLGLNLNSFTHKIGIIII